MKQTNSERFERVLSFFPNNKGVGFALMEGPVEILDKGVYAQQKANNESLMRRIKNLIEELAPERILLEEELNKNDKRTHKSERVKSLITRIEQYAISQHIPVSYYSRERIQFIFSIWKAKSKYDIARVIADNIKPMQYYFYDEVKFPKAEPHYASLFHAISIGITHYYVTT